MRLAQALPVLTAPEQMLGLFHFLRRFGLFHAVWHDVVHYRRRLNAPHLLAHDTQRIGAEEYDTLSLPFTAVRLLDAHFHPK